MPELDRGRAREIAGALVVEIRGRTYVASRSTPGLYWRATAEECDCPNAVFARKFCRHQRAVSEWNRTRAQERNQAA